MGHIAELDGLRTLAVLPVIAFHFGANVDGTAGVTVFFALSGYIVTMVLLTEHATTGNIGLGRFYLRRFRRLLPAATLVVIATIVVGRLMSKPPLGRQAVAALTYWANIERYTGHYTYGQRAYAPLEHFWSLAMEEQFYLFLPLLVIAMLAINRRWLAPVTAVLVVASATFAFVHRHEPLYYFHPAARVGELLIGVLLAVIGRRMPSWIGYVGLGVLVVILLNIWTPPAISIAAITCLVIAARPRVLAIAPLPLIGIYSYGLYLWHPLSAVISDRVVTRIAVTIAATLLSYHLVEFPIRRRLSSRRAVPAMASLSVSAAVVLIVFPQSLPLRFAAPAPVVAAAPVAVVAAVTSVATIPSSSTSQQRPTHDTLAADDALDGSAPPTRGIATAGTTAGTAAQTTTAATTTTAAATTTTAAATTTTAPAPRPLRISAAGDSTEMFMDGAWQVWAAEYPDAITWVKPPMSIVPWTSGADDWIHTEAAKDGFVLPFDGPQGGLDRQGCPLIYDLGIRAAAGLPFLPSAKLHGATPIESCDWHLWIPDALAEMDLDVLIVSWSVTAMWDYVMSDGSTGHVGEPAFDTVLKARMDDFEAMAATYGTKVLWTTYQPLSTLRVPQPWTTYESADALAASVLPRECVADLRPLIRADPTSKRWYQDGYHFNGEGAAKAISVIAPQITVCAAAPWS